MLRRWIPVLLVVLVAGWALYAISQRQKPLQSLAAAAAANHEQQKGQPPMERVQAPDFDGGVAWLNTAGPISIKDLRGKFVLVDFWTFCCINCIHVLPHLAQLEKKYPNELVVIGVHSAKFENEKSTDAIRKAVLRYEIAHPVVNDANMKIWRRFGANSWPTMVLIDPEGNVIGKGSGEGLQTAIDELLTKLIKVHKEKKTLKEGPMRFDLAKFKERGDSPLFFPGKVLADVPGNRLFIADSTHHRIVITDLTGKKIAIAGAGESSAVDGSFEKATFNDPQGMALRGETLYVADRRNHLIRELDLKNRTVKTIAGLGKQGEDRWRGGPGLTTGLNSPWDLLVRGNDLYIAMAGHHQIWVMDLEKGRLRPYAGDGREDIKDGPLEDSHFAQPSGLTTDGKNLYVADSEVSAIRSVPLDGKSEVKTLVGEGLFEFGDLDGVGREVRLQHALGVAFYGDKLYVADTYNSKIKQLDPATRTCTTVLGGKKAQWEAGEMFNEPAGICVGGDKLYVADTNNHRIRVIDLKSKKVETLNLQGVEAPKVARLDEAPSFPKALKATLPLAKVSPDGVVTLNVTGPWKTGAFSRMLVAADAVRSSIVTRRVSEASS